MAIQSTDEQNSPAPSGKSSAILGAAVPRIDGPLKTSGIARYSADFNLPRMVYAIPVCATIGSGRITQLDTSRAQGMRGVLKVYSYGHVPKLYRPDPSGKAWISEGRMPFEDETILYNGQYVALVVAETMDQARQAAAAVKVAYATTPTNVSPDLKPELDGKLDVQSKRGDAEQAFAGGPVTVDEVYVTPVETHNPIELHATVADYDGHNFTIYESTQGIENAQVAMAQMLGVPLENVRIVMQFLGSGFGGKLAPWPHAPLAAAASRDLNRPVKVVVDRHMMFTNVGHRPRTTQRVRLSATPDGKLNCIWQDYTSNVSLIDGDHGEGCGEATPSLWSTPNLLVRDTHSKRNIGHSMAMRGPGAVPGLFATESALNELAVKLNMDPIQLRLLNEPAIDESKNKPFSSRHMKECLTVGAERFGWKDYDRAIGSMKRDNLVLGWGLACAQWGSGRAGVKTRVSLLDDGTARVFCGTQDIGTGTYTIFAQVVHARTGIPMEKISVSLGDTKLPSGPMSGGSVVTGSVVPAVDLGAKGAAQQMLKVASQSTSGPLSKKPVDQLELTDGYVHLKGSAASSGMRFEQVLQQQNVRAVTSEGNMEGTDRDPAAQKFAFHSFGVHFAEVEYDPGIARMRVSRITSVIDVGKIINEKAARNQMEGAIMMGIGMALFEETQYDPRNGRPTNNNLADYIVATNPDTPQIDVHFLDYPDTNLSSIGARGVGEIGLAGIAPAITAAIYQATGVRKRELPVRIEDLLPPMRQA